MLPVLVVPAPPECVPTTPAQAHHQYPAPPTARQTPAAKYSVAPVPAAANSPQSSSPPALSTKAASLLLKRFAVALQAVAWESLTDVWTLSQHQVELLNVYHGVFETVLFLILAYR